MTCINRFTRKVDISNYVYSPKPGPKNKRHFEETRQLSNRVDTPTPNYIKQHLKIKD
jgi:hypothetical protein